MTKQVHTPERLGCSVGEVQREGNGKEMEQVFFLGGA